MRIKKIAAVCLAGAVAGSVLLGGCGRINPDAVVATINKDTEITLGYANFVAHYQQAGYDFLYSNYYGDDYWTNDDFAQDGKNMQQTTKEGIMDSIETDFLLEQHMKDYQVEITDEERDKIKAAAEKFMSDNSRDAIRQMGATQEYVEKMLYYETVAHKMRDAIYAETDTNVTDEEAAQKTYSYMRISLEGDYDDEGNYAAYTEEEAEEVKAKAPEVAAAAKKDFEAASKKYGYEILTNSYGADEVLDEDDENYNEYVNAADKLKEGEVSDLIEGDSSDYIIRMDSLFDRKATDAKKEEIISERQMEHFTEVTDGYKEKADFSLNEKQWGKVNFSNLFTDATAGTDDETSAPAE